MNPLKTFLGHAQSHNRILEEEQMWKKFEKNEL